MPFLFNDSNIVTTIYLSNNRLDLGPKESFLLDQKNVPEAIKWCANFTNLKVVEVIPEEVDKKEKTDELNSTPAYFKYLDDNSIIIELSLTNKNKEIIDNLNILIKENSIKYSTNKLINEDSNTFEQNIKTLESDCAKLTAENEKLQKEINDLKAKTNSTTKKETAEPTKKIETNKKDA